LSEASDKPARGEGVWRHLATAGALALIFYVAGFWWIEHRRTAKGPWRIEFRSDPGGRPSLEIRQGRLGIWERLSFPDDTAGRRNVAEWVEFKEARTNVPLGELLMQDALYLPGTITLRLCGHQIEVLPRTLIVDGQEHAWKTGEEVMVRGEMGNYK